MRLKIEAARRQLGTALFLFMEDMDPVSVQCLAAGGGEVMEFYAQKVHGKSLMNVLIETHPLLDPTQLRRDRNAFWNAFKHASEIGRRGERNDETLLAEFDEEMNVQALMIGWTDYGNATRHMPIEAQVFQVWAFARKPPPSRAERLQDECCRMFPRLDKAPMREQKERLKSKIAEMRQHWELMGNPMTDARALVLPWSEKSHRSQQTLASFDPG